MKHTEDAREILARIGAMLIQIQRTELTVNFCIKHVLPKTARPTKDMFATAARRPPLGRLIAELHRHVAVPDSFRAILNEFLDKRNVLVHQIEFIPGWTLETEKGLAVAYRFLERLEGLERRVARIFGALLKAWTLEHGCAGRESRLLPMSDKAYQNLIRSLG
jgi:hypothetical protein